MMIGKLIISSIKNKHDTRKYKKINEKFRFTNSLRTVKLSREEVFQNGIENTIISGGSFRQGLSILRQLKNQNNNRRLIYIIDHRYSHEVQGLMTSAYKRFGIADKKYDPLVNLSYEQFQSKFAKLFDQEVNRGEVYSMLKFISLICKTAGRQGVTLDTIDRIVNVPIQVIENEVIRLTLNNIYKRQQMMELFMSGMGSIPHFQQVLANVKNDMFIADQDTNRLSSLCDSYVNYGGDLVIELKEEQEYRNQLILNELETIGGIRDQIVLYGIDGGLKEFADYAYRNSGCVIDVSNDFFERGYESGLMPRMNKILLFNHRNSESADKWSQLIGKYERKSYTKSTIANRGFEIVDMLVNDNSYQEHVNEEALIPGYYIQSLPDHIGLLVDFNKKSVVKQEVF